MRIIGLVAAVPLAVALGGCVAPMPIQVSGATARTDIDLPRCGLRVGFAGTPRQISADDSAIATAPLSKYFTWTTEGWYSQQYRMTESAVCVCRDTPHTPAELSALIERFRINPRSKNFKVKEDSVGTVADYDGVSTVNGAMAVFRNVFPTAFPSCFLVARVLAPEATAAASSVLFFSRITAVSQQGSTNSPVAERLRQLDKLFADGLITREEYAAKRRAILSQL